MKWHKVGLFAGVAGLFLCAGCREIAQDGNFFPEQNGILSKCLSEKTAQWDISYCYPCLTESTGSQEEQLDAQIEAFVEERVGVFREEHTDTSQYFWGDWLEDSRSEEFSLHTFQMDYTVERSDALYFSVTFDGYFYTKLAAHPTHCFDALTIDRETYEIVQLSDLYTADAAFVQIVRSYLEKQLPIRYSDTETGASAVEDILKTFDARYDVDMLFSDTCPMFLTENELGLSIDTGRYALGDHFEVRIPLSDLEIFAIA